MKLTRHARRALRPSSALLMATVIFFAGFAGCGGKDKNSTVNPFAGSTLTQGQPATAASRYYNTIPPNTLLLGEYTGPNVPVARSIANELKQAGLKDAFVIEDDDEAFLCYGTYGDTDPTSNKKYAEDKQRLAMVRGPDGRRAFNFLMAVPMPEPTPHSPYDITLAPAPYTVLVGTFDLYGRKQQAADYARKLRDDGWEAYVYQGEAMSHVAVGAFHIEIFEPLPPGSHAKQARKLRSPEVKKIIADFKYFNWNGHQFSDADTDELKLEVTGKAIRGPKAGRKLTVTEDLSGLVRVGVFRIPEKVWTSAGLPVPPASITPRTTVLKAPPGPILSPER